MFALMRLVLLTIFLVAVSGARAQAPARPASAGEHGLGAQSKTAVNVPARLDEVARSMASRGLFQGVVLVARGDHVLLERSYGRASLDGLAPDKPGLCYWLGSVTKQFTAAAVLRLVDQGKLRLDDPIRMYLPDTPPAWTNVTVRQLLSHTAGVPNDSGLPDDAKQVTPQMLWEHIKVQPLDFEPGTGWHYSNSGYTVLGLLIETITGRAYGENLQAEFLGPLGMTHTGELGDTSSSAECARGLVRYEGTLRAADPVDPNVEVGACNLYSTAGDLLRWQRALYGGRVLKPASLKAMTTPVRNEYALGLDVDRVDGRLRYQHHGVISGFSTNLVYEPKEGLTIAVLSNDEGAATPVLSYKLLRVVLGQSVILPNERRVVKIDPSFLAGLAGTYALATGETAWVVQRGDELLARIGGQPWGHLQADSPDAFFSSEQDIDWRFERTSAGSGAGAALALRVPALSGSRRWIHSAAPPLDVAGQIIYLRGTMNNWGLDQPMKLDSDGLLRLSLELLAGSYSFKMASADGSAFKWGSTATGAAMAAAGEMPLMQAGNRLQLSLPEPAICKFTLDGRDILAPSLAWACEPK
jgi:CubicO group peptidase (beta-lactamase class C family)